MNRVFTHYFIMIISTIAITACGGGGGGGDDADNGDNGGVSATLSISGDDTAVLGDELELQFYAFRENFNGADTFLAATSSGIVLDSIRASFGELSLGDIDTAALAQETQNAVIFNVMEFGISMRVNIDNVAYLYSLTCPGGCSEIVFDPDARMVSIDNAVVEATIGGSTDSMATAPLTINGAITWASADENPNAPANGPDSTNDGGGGNNNGGDGLTLSDIVGVWDQTIDHGNGEIDEYYAVFKANGDFIDYDYLGDSFNMGNNCYDRFAGTIEAQGNGEFLVDGNNTVTITQDGDNLVVNFGGQQFTLRPTTLQESDFVPICDA